MERSNDITSAGTILHSKDLKAEGIDVEGFAKGPGWTRVERNLLAPPRGDEDTGTCRRIELVGDEGIRLAESHSEGGAPVGRNHPNENGRRLDVNLLGGKVFVP
ncbi:MAG: hypothetical protein M1299_00500 [Firmicutes bacterium]|nr:hypothetical protein [Bacillota bacterium]